jgi:tRNA-(ms[2]io[6]A)-hydroxylase
MSEKVMLGLKLPTDPRWVNIVEKNIEEILTDHAYCEQKAASNAISCIVRFPEYPDVVEEMVRISREEMEHFGMVHQELLKRGLQLGRERKDEYVQDLADYIRSGGGSKEQHFVDRMLFAAMVEARSCERFKRLSEGLSDEYLKKFYRRFMESEAGHYTLFIDLATLYFGKEKTLGRWSEWLGYEKEVMESMEIRGDRIH